MNITANTTLYIRTDNRAVGYGLLDSFLGSDSAETVVRTVNADRSELLGKVIDTCIDFSRDAAVAFSADDLAEGHGEPEAFTPQQIVDEIFARA